MWLSVFIWVHYRSLCYRSSKNSNRPHSTQVRSYTKDGLVQWTDLNCWTDHKCCHKKSHSPATNSVKSHSSITVHTTFHASWACLCLVVLYIKGQVQVVDIITLRREGKRKGRKKMEGRSKRGRKRGRKEGGGKIEREERRGGVKEAGKKGGEE